MKNSDLLWQQLEREPQNTTLKLTLIDALVEDGEQIEAECVRWCLDNHKWPVETPTQEPFWADGSMWGTVWGLDDRFSPIWNKDTRTDRAAILQLRDRLAELELIPTLETVQR